jgi:hypothetical protein
VTRATAGAFRERADAVLLRATRRCMGVSTKWRPPSSDKGTSVASKCLKCRAWNSRLGLQRYAYAGSRVLILYHILLRDFANITRAFAQGLELNGSTVQDVRFPCYDFLWFGKCGDEGSKSFPPATNHNKICVACPDSEQDKIGRRDPPSQVGSL